MSRRLAGAVAGVVALLALGAAAVAANGRAGAGDVPTVRLARGEFVRRVTAEGVLQAARATPLTVSTEIEQPVRIAWLIDDGAPVAEGDLVARLDPTELERTRDAASMQSRVAEELLRKATAARGADLAGLADDARVAAHEAAVATDFQQRDEEVFSRHQRLQSALDAELARHKQRHADERRGTRDRLSATELELHELARDTSDRAGSRASRMLAALEVRAPHAGLALLERSWRGETVRVGDVAWAGFGLAEIPDLSTMEALVQVLEADAGGLAVGQPARVRVESAPEHELVGELSHVDTLARPRARNVPVQFFAATVKLAATEAVQMKPGARVVATITLERIPDALSLPRQAVFVEEGKTVVHRRQGDGFVPVEVKLGSAGLGRVVVLAGVEEGDEVALRDPRRSLGEATGASGASSASDASAGAGGP